MKTEAEKPVEPDGRPLPNQTDMTEVIAAHWSQYDWAAMNASCKAKPRRRRP